MGTKAMDTRFFASLPVCLTTAFLISAALASAARGDEPAKSKLPLDEVKQLRKQAAHRSRGIILNNDGNDSLTAPNDPLLTHEKFLEQRTTALAGTQVSTLFYCTGVFNFYSHHSAETDPLRYTTKERRDQGWELGERGPDTLATIVDFGHRHGMEVFWSMRMNDTHDSYTPHLLCPWKKEHPDWLLAKKGDKRIRSGNGRWSAVNYEIPEVREKVLRILTDVAERYNVEGIELDYFRHPIFFQPQIFGQPVTPVQRDLLTDMMRKVRKMADERAAARGRPLLIAIRVPDSVEYCSGVGIDLTRWLEEDLVDLLVVGGYFQLNPWETSVALGHKYGVPVYPSLDDPRFKDEESQTLRRSDACYRARALEAWTAGGDGVYLFNFFDPHSPLLKELGDPKSLAPLEQLYPFGAREETAAKQWLSGGEKFVNLPEPLPRHPVTLEPGKTATVKLRAVRPQVDPTHSPPQVIARFCFKAPPASPETIVAKVNGQALASGTPDGRWINFPVPPEQVQNGVNRFELTLADTAKTSAVLQDLVLIVRPKWVPPAGRDLDAISISMLAEPTPPLLPRTPRSTDRRP
jgi:hypothetical protein